MSYFVVDVEADGPIPGKFSMVSLGAVKVSEQLDVTHYLEVKPISAEWKPDALAISGFTREQHLGFGDPKTEILKFVDWVDASNTYGRPIFISDNPAFDWMFTAYYLHTFAGRNPFGFSARRIGDLYCGLMKTSNAGWKHLRKTNHDHNPVNDAKGNAEVILHMRDKMGLKIDLR